ncbi:conserved phage C-terminal domain-containing protein [Limosilactobacillus gastricus]|uniref:conserved phage C-terminal domain-containing protein n=1 Tax=Limosilactobacillus gastricus TaxID=227942 RepID=UPI0002D3A6BD|nr:conserved phage C-terminal domain-containing protein [Limosilactobacillus gastricus]
MEQPSYYSILTADVRYDPRLKRMADCKVLYSEITALSNKWGYCTASNSYFAKLYDRPVPTISKWINLLIKLGYLRSELIYDGKEIKQRKLYPISNPINADVKGGINADVKGGINADVKGGINADVKDNSTRVNTTSINKIMSISDKPKIDYAAIVDYLNQQSGNHYRSTTTKTRTLIKARVKEGFTIDDFKAVIDHQCANWKGDPKMERYLRPETLFGTKFEGYLNAEPQRQRRPVDNSDYSYF